MTIDEGKIVKRPVEPFSDPPTDDEQERRVDLSMASTLYAKMQRMEHELEMYKRMSTRRGEKLRQTEHVLLSIYHALKASTCDCSTIKQIKAIGMEIDEEGVLMVNGGYLGE